MLLSLHLPPLVVVSFSSYFNLLLSMCLTHLAACPKACRLYYVWQGRCLHLLFADQLTARKVQSVSDKTNKVFLNFWFGTFFSLNHLTFFCIQLLLTYKQSDRRPKVKFLFRQRDKQDWHLFFFYFPCLQLAGREYMQGCTPCCVFFFLPFCWCSCFCCVLMSWARWRIRDRTGPGCDKSFPSSSLFLALFPSPSLSRYPFREPQRSQGRIGLFCLAQNASSAL